MCGVYPCKTPVFYGGRPPHMVEVQPLLLSLLQWGVVWVHFATIPLDHNCSCEARLPCPERGGVLAMIELPSGSFLSVFVTI